MLQTPLGGKIPALDSPDRLLYAGYIYGKAHSTSATSRVFPSSISRVEVNGFDPSVVKH